MSRVALLVGLLASGIARAEDAPASPPADTARELAELEARVAAAEDSLVRSRDALAAILLRDPRVEPTCAARRTRAGIAHFEGHKFDPCALLGELHHDVHEAVPDGPTALPADWWGEEPAKDLEWHRATLARVELNTRSVAQQVQRYQTALDQAQPQEAERALALVMDRPDDPARFWDAHGLCASLDFFMREVWPQCARASMLGAPLPPSLSDVESGKILLVPPRGCDEDCIRAALDDMPGLPDPRVAVVVGGEVDLAEALVVSEDAQVWLQGPPVTYWQSDAFSPRIGGESWSTLWIRDHHVVRYLTGSPAPELHEGPELDVAATRKAIRQPGPPTLPELPASTRPLTDLTTTSLGRHVDNLAQRLHNAEVRAQHLRRHARLVGGWSGQVTITWRLAQQEELYPLTRAMLTGRAGEPALDAVCGTGGEPGWARQHLCRRDEVAPLPPLEELDPGEAGMPSAESSRVVLYIQPDNHCDDLCVTGHDTVDATARWLGIRRVCLLSPDEETAEEELTMIRQLRLGCAIARMDVDLETYLERDDHLWYHTVAVDGTPMVSDDDVLPPAVLKAFIDAFPPREATGDPRP